MQKKENKTSTDPMSNEEMKTLITQSYVRAKTTFLLLSGIHVLIMLVLALFLIYKQDILWQWLLANLLWAINVSISWYRVNKEYYSAIHILKKKDLSTEVKLPPYNILMVICAIGIPIFMMCQMVEVSYHVVMYQEAISILAYATAITAPICAVINCLIGYNIKPKE